MAELVTTVRDLRARLLPLKQAGKSIGLVPTMGALHLGHRRLLERARRETDVVVASIFVNPLQFDRTQDLELYPRTLDQDLSVCSDAGVDFVFSPPATEIYPREPQVTVEVHGLTHTLCGPRRPGHFRGVATVVLKLFHIVEPGRAYFGEKDAQQLAIIRRMVEDLNIPVEVVPVETVREPDGLALSSRNQRLTAQQREVAPLLSQALFEAREKVERGDISAEAILGSAIARLASGNDLELEYFEIVDRETLAPVHEISGPVLIAGAVWVGGVRLIDNVTTRAKTQK